MKFKQGTYPSEPTCDFWFRHLRSGNFDIEDKGRPGQPKEKTVLESLLNKDSCRIQEGFAELLGVTQPTISVHLKALGMIQ